MRLLLIRHGDPNYELDCLTEKGKREAELLAEKLKKEKIDYIYSSPLGRAKETCLYTAKAMGREKDVVIKDFLQEFHYFVDLPTGQKNVITWDLLPEYWTSVPEMYDIDKWCEQPFMKDGKIDEYYKWVCDGFDEILANHGYVRDGKIYRAEKSNTDTVAIFCHFGLICVLLSHLFSVPPTVLTHSFCGAPTSVTTLYSEERRKGKAYFRCASFGDISHLYVAGEEPSFSARFCEVYGDGTRED